VGLEEYTTTGGNGGGIVWAEAFKAFERAKCIWLCEEMFVSQDETIGQDTSCTQILWVSWNVHAFGSPSRLKDDQSLYIWAPSPAHAAVGLSILFRLIEASNCLQFHVTNSLRSPCPLDECPVPALALSQLLTNNRKLMQLAIVGFCLNKNLIQALEAVNWSELDIDIVTSSFTSLGKNALLKSLLRHNRGPTMLLGSCELEAELLANVIPGNTRLRRLTISIDINACDISREHSVDLFVKALAEDKGLESLSFCKVPFSDQNWSTMCQSLSRHPRLKQLQMLYFSSETEAWSATTKTSRTQQLVDMLQVNTDLCFLRWDAGQRDERLFQDEIPPRPFINNHRPYLQAIRKTPDEWRRQLVGQALAKVNENPTIQWMLLKQNVNTVFGGRAPERIFHLFY